MKFLAGIVLIAIVVITIGLVLVSPSGSTNSEEFTGHALPVAAPTPIYNQQATIVDPTGQARPTLGAVQPEAHPVPTPLMAEFTPVPATQLTKVQPQPLPSFLVFIAGSLTLFAFGSLSRIAIKADHAPGRPAAVEVQ